MDEGLAAGEVDLGEALAHRLVDESADALARELAAARAGRACDDAVLAREVAVEVRVDPQARRKPRRPEDRNSGVLPAQAICGISSVSCVRASRRDQRGRGSARAHRRRVVGARAARAAARRRLHAARDRALPRRQPAACPRAARRRGPPPRGGCAAGSPSARPPGRRLPAPAASRSPAARAPSSSVGADLAHARLAPRHLETEDGTPRNLGPADACTLLRVWLVPAAAGAPRPWICALALASDGLDGVLARRAGPTRMGRDLEGLADAAFAVAALRGAVRHGWLGRGTAAAEGARIALGIGYATAPGSGARGRRRPTSCTPRARRRRCGRAASSPPASAGAASPTGSCSRAR